MPTEMAEMTSMEDFDTDMAEPIDVLAEGENDIEIEIIEDAPVEDPPEKTVSVQAEEEGRPQSKAEKRIHKLTYDRQEALRGQEAAERSSQELVAHAERQASEIHQLKGLLHRGERVMLDTASDRAKANAEQAKAAFRTAFDAGDTDALADAQEAMSTAQAERVNLQGRAAVVPEPAQRPEPVPQQRPVDPKLSKWLNENSWYGKDDVKTSIAFGVHQELVAKQGIHPESQEYFDKLDERTASIFSAMNGSGQVEEGVGTSEPVVTSSPRSLVGSANRSSNGASSTSVRLTETQRKVAKTLGVPIQEYAKQVLKQQQEQREQGNV